MSFIARTMRSHGLAARLVGATAVAAAVITLGASTASTASAAGIGSAHPLSAAVHTDNSPASGQVVSTITTKVGTLTILKDGLSRPLTVHPDSSKGCAGSNPEVCLTITGSGAYVGSMENDTWVAHTEKITMLIEGPGRVYVSDTFTADGGDWYSVDWAPATYEPTGSYCAGTIINNGGTYACNSVTN
jgi:hypothetical protein